MTPCPRCHRHLRDAEVSCPFCASSLPLTVLKVTAVLLTPIVLAACYGPPRGEPITPEGGSPAPSGSAPAPDAGRR
jgi:hypothetical protein